MSEPNTKETKGGSLCLFDDRGTLLGTVERPKARDPLGPGRAKVYLAPPARRAVRPAAAA